MALFQPSDDGSPTLALLTLGVVGDVRPMPDLQPVLPEGIHLRWGFNRDPNDPVNDRGFPWYGFYLFRRLSLTGGATTCVATQLAGQTPGTLPGDTLTLPLGTLQSDRPLRLTDDFPATGTVEVDLSGGTFVDFQMSPAAPSRRVDVTLGFVADFPPAGGGAGPGGTTTPGGTGQDPRGQLGSGGAPANCGCGCQPGTSLHPILDRVVSLGNGQFRATFGYDSSAATATAIAVGPQNRFFPDPADQHQPTVFQPGRHDGAFAVVFDGRPIAWTLAGITVTASAADATAGTPGGGSTGGPGTGSGSTGTDGIVVTALRAGVPVATRVVAGLAGQVVTVSLAFEAIDEVRLSSGPARLVNLCAVSASDGVGQGWAPVANFPQPMCLPVRHPDYPCRPGTINRDESEAFALARIHYGPPDPWSGDNFTALHDTLVRMVQQGPTKGITDDVEDVPADPDPTDPNPIRPVLSQESALDLVLAASVNPAMAQMLGLYWIDDTAVEGQSYDYLIVADDTNAGQGNVTTMLGRVTAGIFANVDAYMAIGVARVASPALAPPDDLRAYALPVGAVPPTVPGDAAGLVGVRWDVPLVGNGSGKIAPGGSVLFHVWRKDFGRVAPSGPAAPDEYLRVTTDVPVAPPRPDPANPPVRLTGWPNFDLLVTNGPLVEGWYGYRVSGIDLFGRYSERSAPAVWRDLADVQVLDGSAVHLIDTTPPPAPTQVQAFVLDPQDTFLLKDTAYNQWAGTHHGVMGLRVRWVWDGKQMRMAPDTREFRIYVQPGSSMQGAGVPANWQQRIAVVGIDEQITGERLVAATATGGAPLTGSNASLSGSDVVLGDGPSLLGSSLDGLELELPAASGGQTRFTVVQVDIVARKISLDQTPQLAGNSAWTLGVRERSYEVFLPGAALAVTPALLLPVSASLQTPVSYGLVGVSAADDKDHGPSVDTAAAGPLVPRIGNEGAVGGPSVVYQVWRQPPLPPDAPFSQIKLQATRADFNSRSFFTLHYSKQSLLSAHVWRALDDSLFLNDAKKGFPSATRNTEVDGLSAGALGLTGQRFQTAANAVKALTSSNGYLGLSDDALQVLGSLPSNATAFSCLTRAPLDSADPSNDDRIGPADNPTLYTPAAIRGAYVDTLDGRASNRYFYRTSFLDGAHNSSPLGASTAPVYLPKATLPTTPAFTKVTVANGQVVLTWTASRESNAKEYHLYRAANAPTDPDLPAMQRIAVVNEPDPLANPSDPQHSRPITRSFTDSGLTGLVFYSYRVTTVDTDGTESAPSPVSRARVPDEALPAPPVPTLTRHPELTPPTVQASWTSPDETVLQQSVNGGAWLDMTTFQSAGPHTFVDDSPESVNAVRYRVTARKYTGAIKAGDSAALPAVGP